MRDDEGEVFFFMNFYGYFGSKNKVTGEVSRSEWNYDYYLPFDRDSPLDSSPSGNVTASA